MERSHGIRQRSRGAKRSSRASATVLALAILIVITGAIPAFAGLASGSYSNFTCGSYGYRNKASVETASYGATAGTYVGSNPSVSRPTGWYGAKARLYNSSNALKLQTPMIYSSSPCYGMAAWTEAYGVHGNYYSWGLSQSWTGSGYHGHVTYKSPLQTY